MRVRFVVPTSTSRAPDAARISGMRNDPPISTSWPREITTSRPRASAASASSTAAALLLTAIAASAPVSSRTSGSTCAWRLPRSPALEVVLEVGVAARRAVDRLERLERERRAAEVRVDHDAGRVDHRAERRAPGRAASRRRRGPRSRSGAGRAAVARRGSPRGIARARAARPRPPARAARARRPSAAARSGAAALPRAARAGHPDRIAVPGESLRPSAPRPPRPPSSRSAPRP